MHVLFEQLRVKQMFFRVYLGFAKEGALYSLPHDHPM
jgi:hypothetical protein